MLNISQIQAIDSSIGPGHQSEDSHFFTSKEVYEGYTFEISAVFRKYHPQTLIVTPSRTDGTGIFLFASIEWGNPVVLETIRSVLLASIANGSTNIRAIWAKLNRQLVDMYRMASTRSVIGRIYEGQIRYISSGLGFYRLDRNKEPTIELLCKDTPCLGLLDTDLLVSMQNQQKISGIETLDIEKSAIFFLPDYLIFNHRLSLLGQLDDSLQEETDIDLDGGILLKALLEKDSAVLTDRYFFSHFAKDYDLSGCTVENIAEYLFVIELLNKGASRKFISRSKKWDKKGTDWISCANFEYEVIKEILDSRTIRNEEIVMDKSETQTTESYRLRLNDAVFPSSDEFEDLAILRLYRQ